MDILDRLLKAKIPRPTEETLFATLSRLTEVFQGMKKG